MKKILVVDDEQDIREILVFIIESELDNEIIEASSGNEAIEILKNNNDIGIIFCDYRMGNGNGGVVYDYIRKQKIIIPYVLLSTEIPGEHDEFKSFFDDHPHNVHLTKPLDDEKILEVANRAIIESGNGHQLPETKYCRANVLRFMKMNENWEIRADVHVKLSENKFVKIIDKNDKFDPEIIEKYKAKGVEFVYIEENDYRELVKMYNKKTIIKLQAKSSQLDKVGLQLTSIEQIHECALNIGIDETSIELTNQIVNSILDVAKKHKQMKSILDRMLDKNKSYLFQHSQITAYTSCAIARMMDWMQVPLLEKLITASLFQDISYDSSGPAMIRSIASKEFEHQDRAIQELIKIHMYDSIKILEKLPIFSNDIKNLIMNHHEMPDGSGFPRKLSATNVTPFEAILIISGLFAHKVIMKGTSEEVKLEITNYFKSNFNIGNYKKPLKALLKICMLP